MKISELAAVRDELRAEIEARANSSSARLAIGMATCGMAAGALPVFEAFKNEFKKNNLESKISLVQTGCIGTCAYEPMVEITFPGQKKITYIEMTADKAARVVSEHLIGGKVVEEYTIDAVNGILSLDDAPIYKTQKHIALRNCGIIDPENIKEYIAMDGYSALGKALTEMTPAEVVDTIKRSGLRGRGGAGFSTGLKWEFTAREESDQKYVCCNADEGDPGAFMDRSILEGDPFSVIEAMTIAGYAINANQGYIYIRAEYPVAVKRLNIAIAQAKENGLLGNNIFGTNFNFDLAIRLGAGAFVCGEETALLTSIEGHRGEPRPRPPFPAVKGLFGKPTLLNNVETYANITKIILNGADWFAGMGTEKSKGTKVFALGGKVNNVGLVEVEMGTTLREIVEVIGGGIPKGKKYKAAQTGGPSGGCIPAQHLDTPIDYDNLLAIGSMMGSGGLIVIDEDNCMVDIAKYFLEFTVGESCGKCSPCRIGTKRLLEMLEKITRGEGTLEDLDKIQELSTHIKGSSLCALGQSAPNPVLSTLHYFRDEYEAHVKEKRCPAGVCKDLLSYEIIDEKCKKCNLCAKACPVDAIAGKVKETHTIDKSKCIKCGACVEKCKFGAIIRK